MQAHPIWLFGVVCVRIFTIDTEIIFSFFVCMLFLKKIKHFLLINTSPKQTVVKNTFWLLIGEWIYKVAQAVIVFSLAFLLGKEQFGIYSYVTSITGVILLIVDFNLTQTSIRAIQQWFLDEQTTVQQSLLLKMLLSVCCFFLLIIISLFLWEQAVLYPLLLTYFCYLVIANTTNYLRSTYRYQERMEREAMFKTISWSLLLIGWTISLFVRQDLAMFMYGLLIIWAIDLTITCLYLPRHLFSHLRKNFNTKTMFSLMKYGSSIALSSFLINIYISADQIILWAYGQLEWLGTYAFAYKITFFYTLFSSAFFNAIFPISTARITQENSRSFFLQGTKKILQRNSSIIIFLILVTYLLQKFGGSFLWEYTDILWVLQILRLYCFIEPIGHWWYTVLLSVKKDNLNTLFLAIAAGINILGNILFIPTYWYIAAARVTVISYLVYSLLCFFALSSCTPQMSKE